MGGTKWGGSLLGALLLCTTSTVQALPSVVLFESDQVRPLALAAEGNVLYAVNTPDNALEIYAVTGVGLQHLDSVPVGLEPVAVSVRNNREVWVVNHLSDSVSVVDVSNPVHGRVVRTLLVGDEPRDVVFAGRHGDRAFITTAHRGQNVPYDPQFTTPGVGRADVWVFDAEHLGGSLGGTPLTILNLFTDTPRALAVTPDGSTVYAAGFKTGNKTTIVTENVQPPLPPPLTNYAGVEQPAVGLIVRHDGQHWVDELGDTWDEAIQFNLPDKDVFAIDANANPPVPKSGAGGEFRGVGTVLLNMAVNPVSGKVYVSNTEALNERRFEGPGVFAGHTVRGHHNENRITVLDGTNVLPRHLNKHIDYGTCCAPAPNAESERSIALPTGMAVTRDGKWLYVAALGSSKVAFYRTAALESDSFQPNLGDQVALSGGGPTGLVLDEHRKRLYVLTRFDNAISIIDTERKAEIRHVPMFNPEPSKIRNGRRFLYDANLSSHGDSACASCHVFGDKDELSWDLGNPDGDVVASHNALGAAVFSFAPAEFAPMKGPFSTQSLRGMANHGPMHWRGDRTGAPFEPNAQPDSGSFDERAAFRQFQAGFVGLLGRAGELPASDMEAFTDFALQLTYPPNPVRNLDDSLTAQQQMGRDFFFNNVSDIATTTCQQCHVTNPQGNAEFGVEFPGFFGSDGTMTPEPVPQLMKAPHLRNLYTKVGMFGMIDLFPLVERMPGMMGHMGDQIRGFGFNGPGDVDTIFRFVHVTSFSQGSLFGPNPGGFAAGEAGAPLRRAVEAFILAFDSNLKPIVGQQMTLTKANRAVAQSRIDLLLARAEAGDCDLVMKADLGGRRRGYLYLGNGTFRSDRHSEAPVSHATLQASLQAPSQSLTYTCTPPGSGTRIGIDRDADGVLDGDDTL